MPREGRNAAGAAGLSATGLAAAIGVAGLGSFLAARESDPARSLSFGALGISAALACAACALAALGREPVAARLGLGPARLGAGTTGLLALGLVALSQALESAISLAGWRAHSVLPLFDEAVAAARGADRVLVLVALGLVPGVAEELFCRGWMQRGLTRRLPPAVAIGLAAAVFGVLHGDPVHAGAAFALGLYLGWVAWIGDSVRPAMVCHVANNAVAVGWVGLRGAPDAGAEPDRVALVALVAGCTAVSLLAVRRALRGIPSGRGARPEAGAGSAPTPPEGAPAALQTAPRPAEE